VSQAAVDEAERDRLEDRPEDFHVTSLNEPCCGTLQLHAPGSDIDSEEIMNARPDPDDAERRNEREAVAREIAARISARGIHMRGNESSDEIIAIEDAIERFEEAVESRGCDLMMDEPPRGQPGEPDDPRFQLPARDAGMSATAYVERLARAVDTLRTSRRKP
jgi:hypothetical protein